MSHCACAEATEGCGYDLKMFLRKFCGQGKSFNSVPQVVLDLYNIWFKGAVYPRLYVRRINTTCESKFILGNFSLIIPSCSKDQFELETTVIKSDKDLEISE